MRHLYKSIYGMLLLCLIASVFFQTASAQVQTPRYVSMTANSKGYYEYLPQGYDPNGTATYPLLIFIHGMGETGDGSAASLPKVLYNGPPRLINQGIFPTSFTVNGQTHKFIVISPQFVGWPLHPDIQAIINYLVQNYRVNTNRIYLTGLSMGGGAVWDYAGENTTYAGRLAAIVPVCGASYPEYSRARHMAEANLPVWATHNEQDGTVPVSYTNEYIRQINLAPAPNPLAKKTIWQSSSHDAWSKTYDPNYRENGMNVYEWMLSYQRGGSNPPPVNQLPVANAGADVNITLPANSVQLNGNASSDPDGSISAYSWARVSGPTQFTINNSNIVNPLLSNLAAGTYVFRLTVTDNSGASATDDITINVAAANLPPVANAGADVNLTLPANSTQLNGNGSSDADGSIASYSWARVSGPTQFTLSNSAIVNPLLSNLAQGSYVFRLTVTDNKGATATDDLTINVNAAPNQTPVANAGADVNLVLPANSTQLNGNGSSDPDGTVTGYNWAKVSGPTQFTLSNSAIVNPLLSNLAQGSYVFRLTVTDNRGATATDDITINVTAAANQAPTVNAGTPQTITLPVNSVTVTATASDPDGSIASYIWTKVSGPAAGTIVSAAQAQTSITNLTEGSYTFQVKVTDNSGATATSNITITVNAAVVDPPPTGATRYIKVNVYGGLNPYNNNEWNNWNTGSATSNIVSGAFKYSDGTNSGISGVISQQVAISDNASNYTGGMAPAEVLRYTSYASGNRSLTINGLTPAKTYSLELYASRVINAGETTIYSVGSTTITIQSYNNHDNKAVFTSIAADAQGRIVVNISNGVSFNYLNGFILTENNASVPVNQPPVANAGADVNLTLPANSTQLNGNGSADPDGTIAGYSWTRVSGPTQFTLSNSAIVNPLLSNLTQGSYIFRLTVTDNSGATATDDITINVAAAANQVPVANAGADVNLTLPANSTQLNGNGSADPDGTIAGYSWTRVSGPTQFTLSNSAIVNPLLSNLVQGSYVFRLTVTDNRGATATDDLTINVAAAANQAPTVNAGTAQTITLPVNSVTLTATGADADGSIVSYAWIKLSGPVSSTINSPAQAQTTVTNLTAGTYVFQVKVTDNSGATATANVTIVVNDAVIPPANTTKYIKVNVYGGQNPYNNSEWNNWNTSTATSNIVSSLFRYSDGTSSTVYATLSSQIAISDNASNYTGGMAPAEVLRYTSYASGIRVFTINGLTPSKGYSLELYASRVINASEVTTYTIGQVSASVQTFNNHDKKAIFNNLTADAQGRIVVSIKNEVTFNYLNGFILTETAATGGAPTAKPEPEQPVTQSIKKMFTVYPNPVTDQFMLQMDNSVRGQVKIQVADVSGSVKKTFSLRKEQEFVQKSLNIGDLLAGTYIIIVQSGDWRESMKIIKL